MCIIMCRPTRISVVNIMLQTWTQPTEQVFTIVEFLADRTNGRAIGIVLRPSVVCLYGMYCG